MADITAIGGSFGSANSFGGTYYGVVEQQKLQNYLLVVDNALHGHTTDAVSVTQQHNIVVSDAAHTHVVDNVTVTQQHTIVVNDTTHGLTSDTPWLIYNTSLAVDNAIHAHTVDSISIVQQHTLVASDAVHSLTFDAVSIVQQHSLVVSDTTHSLTYDGNLVLNQFLLMNKPDDAYHGLSSTNITVSGNQIIVVDDAKHILYLDSPGIVNWSDLEKFFGIYKPEDKNFGSLTTAQLAELRGLYSKLVIKYGSLQAVEAELGIHKKQYGETGQLLEAALITGLLKPSNSNAGVLELTTTTGGIVKQILVNAGSLLSNQKNAVLMFDDGFAWLSEDGLFRIIEEDGSGDRIKIVSNGILKQGNIEYGKL